MRKTTLTLLLIGIASAAALAGVKTESAGDPSFDFKTLKTWAWSESPGDFKVWVSSQTKPEPIKQRFEPMIFRVVNDELPKRGFPRAAEGAAPDFFVTYWALITTGMSAQTMGQFLPAVANWGIPPFVPSTQSFSVYPEGSLVLDITSAATKNVVWRGLAQSEMSLDRPDTEREKRLRDAVRDLLKKFPPKK